MKKLLHISIIALFVMAPTFGWAEMPTTMRSAATDNDIKYQGFTVLTDEQYNELRDDEKAIYDANLLKAQGMLLPTGTENPDTEGVYFGLKEEKSGDNKNVATAQYVKGAYNQLTKRINKVYRKAITADEKEYEGKVGVCTTWDDDSCSGSYADVEVSVKGATTTTSGGDDNG